MTTWGAAHRLEHPRRAYDLPVGAILTRARAREVVAQAIAGSRFPLRWYGSWARGDFHLDVRRQLTFSDLDLQGDPVPVEQWAAAADAVRRQLDATLPMRVSVRRSDVHELLRLPTSGWVALATYLSCLRGSTGDTPAKRAYLTAKVLLLLNRIQVDETPEGVARRLGTAAAREAYAMKIGARRQAHFSSRYRDELAAGATAPHRAAFFAIYHHPEDDTVAELLRSELDTPELARDTYAHVLAGMTHGK